MSELAIVLGVFAWLGLAGWSFRKLAPGTPDGLIGSLFTGCLVLGPFVAGVIIADRKPKAAPPPNPIEETQ